MPAIEYISIEDNLAAPGSPLCDFQLHYKRVKKVEDINRKIRKLHKIYESMDSNIQWNRLGRLTLFIAIIILCCGVYESYSLSYSYFPVSLSLSAISMMLIWVSIIIEKRNTLTEDQFAAILSNKKDISELNLLFEKMHIKKSMDIRPIRYKLKGIILDVEENRDFIKLENEIFLRSVA